MLIFLLFVFIVCFLAVYFLPSFIAIGRKHVHTLQITILNAFLGWSFIAWVAALIWATMCESDEKAQTKASWIIIAVIFLFSILPLIVVGTIPYKSSSMIETQYKKVIYSSPDGKIKQEIQTQNIKGK